jgi:hypothetical protein
MMSMRRFRLTFVLAVVAAVTVVLSMAAAPAYAAVPDEEIDNGDLSTSGPPSGLPCAQTTGSRVCFQADGDYWWVRDTVADGSYADVYWEAGQDSTNYRRGECRNRHGYGTWAVCNKNYVEGRIIFFQAERCCKYHSYSDLVTTYA